MSSGAEAGGPVPLEPEELARANLYGLVSRFFIAAPDPNLLAEVSRSESAEAAGEAGGMLVAAWRDLREACRGAYPARVRQEYDALLLGVGRAEVTPYLSAYAGDLAPDRFLVALRARLREWGLARSDGAFEVEDHISGVCDTARWLITGGHPLAQQRVFFNAFVYRGAVAFFAAVQQSPNASFYRLVAAFGAAFFELEKAAFDLDDLDSPA